MNFAKDVEIDQDALDVEWLEQPRRMHKYATLAANARFKLDLAKERLDIGRAEIDKDVRANPEKYGLKKDTETAVQNAILLTHVYQDLNAAYLDAKNELEIARIAVQAIEQRKDSLENLVRLHGMNYFAGPSVPRDLSKEAARKRLEEESDEKIADTMKSRRVRRERQRD